MSRGAVFFLHVATLLHVGMSVQLTVFQNTRDCQPGPASVLDPIQYTCTCSCCSSGPGCTPQFVGFYPPANISNSCSQCSISFCQTMHPTECPSSLTLGRVDHPCNPV